jgi:hypothetical protein
MVDPPVAVVDSVEDMRSPHPRAGPMPGAPLAAALGHITVVALARTAAVATAPIMAAGGTTVAEAITVVGDIMAQALALVSASTRLMGTQLRSAIRPDSMTQMVCGKTIPAAPCRTDIRLDRRAALAPRAATSNRAIEVFHGMSDL